MLNMIKKPRKFHIERVNLKDKRVIGNWRYDIEVKGSRPSGVLKFHQDMGEALDFSITEHEI